MQSKNTQRLLNALLSLGIAPSLVAAQEVPVAWKIVLAEPFVNEVEVGIGYVGDDSYRFGRYNGLVEEGPYLIGEVNAKDIDDDGGFWRLRGTNLGLDSRYLRFDAGVQGRQQFFIEYDQLPNYMNDTWSSPFTNPGSTRLNLPTGYRFSNLDSYLLPFDLETQRKRLGLGGKIHLKRRWQLSGSVSRETKEGTDWTGAAMGPSTPDNIFKFTNGALLPEPIDYETNKIDVALNYLGKKTQLEFAYHGSLFSNNDTSINWTDPLFDPNPGLDSEVYRPGSISLEPDNQMHQLSAVMGHMLSTTSRLTGLLSVSHLSQDENFLPYSVYDTVDSLPQESADAEVWLYRGQLKLTSRPMSKLRLSAQYNYDERDNKTDTYPYNYILADGVPGEAMINPRSNDPLSYRRQKIDLTANYRLNAKVGLRGGYEFNHIHRDHDDNQRETTRENTLSAKIKVKPIPVLNFDIYGEYGERDGSTYYPRDFEHEDLRVYYLADLDRTKAGLTINYMPFNRWSLGFTTEYLKDDYTESEIGLRESRQRSALLNASYQISDKISTHAYYNYQDLRSNNANENKEIEKGSYDVWEADLDDSSNSFGLGFDIDGLTDKWDVGMDWVWTDTRGSIDMTGYRARIDKKTGDLKSAFKPIETEQFSDAKTRLNSLELWAKYRYSDKIVYKLGYWYEQYRSEDWAIEGTINNYYPLENDTIQQFLFPGEDKLDYNQHVVGLSMIMKF